MATMRDLICGVLLAGVAVVSPVQAESLDVLAQTRGWLRLGHYETSWNSASGWRSAIHSPEFFLAEQGATDPHAELEATLKAMRVPVQTADNHARCRFPARLQWLREHLPELADELQPVHCPAFVDWVGKEAPASVSILFANGYLGNPASYYGHIFLKVNGRSPATGAHLLDQTANFGAIDTSRDDPLSYIVKGIFGGYDGGFSSADFFFHEANYNENELRDVWEYRLALDEPALGLVVAHVWELLARRYTYYFFHDNCAFRVAELLEVVDGVQATPPLSPWVTPQSVLQQLSQTAYHGQPLVVGRIYHPSRQTRLHQRFLGLKAQNQAQVRTLVAQPQAFDEASLTVLPLQEHQAVLDTLLDYYQYQRDTGAPYQLGSVSSAYLAVLGARLRLPPGGGELAVSVPAAPDTAHGTSWLQLGYRYRRSGSGSGVVRFRPAYYDSLDVSGAQARQGGLSMGEIFAEAYRGRLRVQRLDMIAVDAAAPSLTGLPGDQGRGWRLRAGYEQERVGCDGCGVLRAQGDVTWARGLPVSGSMLAFNLGGALQPRTEYGGLGHVRAGFSLLIRPEPEWGFRFDYELRRPLMEAPPLRSVSRIELRRGLSKDLDVRFLWERDARAQWGLGLGMYW